MDAFMGFINQLLMVDNGFFPWLQGDFQVEKPPATFLGHAGFLAGSGQWSAQVWRAPWAHDADTTLFEWMSVSSYR